MTDTGEGPAAPGDGPRVVAIGGGHGLAATLRAVRTYTDRVTAIVSVADDGGSSGRLRELLHIIPPGDLRKCLIALAEPGSPLAVAFGYRFAEEELAGHSLGNLVLAGLMDGSGDPVAALDEACRLLGVTGRVLPTTTEPVVLKAEADCGQVTGQVAVNGTRHIHRVSLVPADPPAPEAALDALSGADQILLGPGSLFTSVLAAVAVPDCPRGDQPLVGHPGLRLQPAPPGLRDGLVRRGHARGRPGGARGHRRRGGLRLVRDRRGCALRPGGRHRPGPAQRPGPRPGQTGVDPGRSARMMPNAPRMP